MRKIFICFISLVLVACDIQENNTTIDISLAEVPYYSEEYDLDENKVGAVVASKIYDMESKTESAKIVIYVQGKQWHDEIFMSWTENYLINKNCNDKDCLEYLLYEIFQLSSDDFLKEVLNHFSVVNKIDEDFILKRRDVEGYDGFIKVDIGLEKKAQVYLEPIIIVEEGTRDQIIVETRLYEININL